MQNDLLLSLTGDLFNNNNSKNNDKSEENNSLFPKLSLKQRLIGFGVCFGFGLLFQMMAVSSVFGALLGRTEKFTFFLTFSLILYTLSTFFLIGPKKQLKNMFDESRRAASVVFLCSLILTLIFMYLLKIKILAVVCVVAQSCSFVWYVLSYIPYGRDCVRLLCGKICGLIQGFRR